MSAPATPLTLAEYRALKDRADASRRSRMVRARRVAAASGLGASMPFHLAHNAMVGRNYGHDWAGVDYSGVRWLLRAERELWTADRIVRRLVDRRGIAFREATS